MNVPALVQSSLGDEDVAAHVPLKGEDALFVTATRTVVYKADGLLSDESVDEFSHDAEGIEVSEGRRKAKVALDYGLDGEESFSIPAGSLDDVLHPIIAGVLAAAGVTEPGETVKRTYRFSELTLVVTSERVVKHIGSAVWATDYEEIGFDSVTGIDVEEGNVSSQLVLETTERTQRIKAPNEEFRDVRETVEEGVYAYHDADSAAEFERMTVAADAESTTEDVSFGGGVDPIDTSGVGEDDDAAGTDDAGDDGVDTAASTAETEAPGVGADTGEPAAPVQNEAEDEFASSGFQTAAAKVEQPIDPDELGDELDDLEVAIEEMAEALERQRKVAERQREVVDAQQAALDEHRERLAALRDLVDEE